MVELAVNLYTEILEVALPVAIFFEIANLCVSTLLRVGFGGGLWFGKR